MLPSSTSGLRATVVFGPGWRCLLCVAYGAGAAACADNHQGVSVIGGEATLGTEVMEAQPPGRSPDTGRPLDLIGDPNRDACQDEPMDVTALPPVLEIVVDTSGSMNWVPGTNRQARPGERSKWQVTAAALDATMELMPDNAGMGITYYPNRPGTANSCFNPSFNVPIAALSADQRQRVRMANAGIAPAGGTPTYGAYSSGLGQLLAAELAGPKFMLLITDGPGTYATSCDENVTLPMSLMQTMSNALIGGVRTFVIGAPGSQAARGELSRMAMRGGTALEPCTDQDAPYCHFDVSDGDDFEANLRAALADIINTSLACEYPLPTPPPGLQLDLDTLAVSFDDGAGNLQELSPADPVECSSGWQLSNDQSRIVLCPASCSSVYASARGVAPRLRIRFACALLPK